MSAGMPPAFDGLVGLVMKLMIGCNGEVTASVNAGLGAGVAAVNAGLGVGIAAAGLVASPESRLGGAVSKGEGDSSSGIWYVGIHKYSGGSPELGTIVCLMPAGHSWALINNLTIPFYVE